MKEKTGNIIKLALFTVALGAFAGLVIWCFLKATAFCTDLLWVRLPEASQIPFIVVIVCAAGGLFTGIMHKLFGDYPEELSVVMGKIKKDKYYDYRPMPVMLVSAFIPLVLGASVGPEAGLTGIIAGLCYWVGDNVTYARQNAFMFSEIGEAVTLGQLFHSPLFGIFAVEEDKDDETGGISRMSKGSRLLFYGLSTAASFIIVGILNRLFGAAMEGFPSFDEVVSSENDYFMLLIYIPAGLILYGIFELCEKLTKGIGKSLPVIFKETLCGIAVGFMGLFFPFVMFSGEEQMGELIAGIVSYAPLMLAGICLLKIFMTTFCLNLGLKGGHFFPLIFACTCMGYAIAGFAFADAGPHAAFASACVTATVMGAQLKKAFAASLLLLLCFPVKALLWIFLCAVIGKSLAAFIENIMKNKEGKEYA